MTYGRDLFRILFVWKTHAMRAINNLDRGRESCSRSIVDYRGFEAATRKSGGGGDFVLCADRQVQGGMEMEMEGGPTRTRNIQGHAQVVWPCGTKWICPKPLARECE